MSAAGRGRGSQGGAGVGKAPLGSGRGPTGKEGPSDADGYVSGEGSDLPCEVPAVSPSCRLQGTSLRSTAVKWGESSLPPKVHLIYQEPLEKELGFVFHTDFSEKRSSIKPWISHQNVNSLSYISFWSCCCPDSF